MNVADLRADEADSAGHEVLFFYARKPPEYAVYQTRERAMVHFADDPRVSDAQRKVLAQLAPLRGETNGLIDGWREMPVRRVALGFIPLASGVKFHKRAARYDRRIADALIVALEGDLTGAGAVLQEIKSEVIEDRVGRSRFEYLLIAIGVAIGFTIVAGFIGVRSDPLNICSAERNARCFADAINLWRGAMAGALGSFFSIALAIRGRTVLPDLNRMNNLIDAGLRVAIGIIAGTVLVALVLSHFVNLKIGTAGPDNFTELYIGIVGFVGGFAERLVPDLLAKAETPAGEQPVLRKPEPDMDEAAAGKAAPARTGTALAGAPGAPPDEAAADGDGHEDGCVEDVALTDAELTPDENLPAASGGVERVPEEMAA